MTARTTIASLRWKLVQVGQHVRSIPGALVVAAFLVNELLMGISPWSWRPIPWAAFYFPSRAVGVPFVGLLEVIRLIALTAKSPTVLSFCRASLGLIVVAGTIWFNWSYQGMIFFDLFGWHDAPAR